MNRSPGRSGPRGLAILAMPALVVLCAVLLMWPANAGETIPLSKVSHIHGIAFDKDDSGRFYLATHHGVFLASQSGTAIRISNEGHDYMGFTPHPTVAHTFLASGHPETGGNLGVLISRDGAKTWTHLAEGVSGPVDFHAMDISRADPNVVYGLYRGIQVSRDGGTTWRLAGQPPADVFDLAASAGKPDTVYLATRSGLMVSHNGGKNWQPASLMTRAASMVETTADGTIYAFVVGSGLMKAQEPALNWQVVNADWGQDVILHLAVDPRNPDRLLAATQRRGLLLSANGGRTWEALPSDSRSAER